ncbi:STAS domain-containing protein [Peribacillus acanthi]|uniref:STAS domain-containing protein n=1 Tax=Peribacillus acanthi TaxID=2171554 RepID=UPI000D3E3313|nr:STAS domain-containing protein [Peribacillus acanthi]
MFSYELVKEGWSVSMFFNGDLDIDVSEIMEEEIIPNLLPFTEIHLDLSGVPFVDSTGIGLLINLIETVKKNQENVQIEIRNVQPLVKEVFVMLHLEEIFGEKVQLVG